MPPAHPSLARVLLDLVRPGPASPGRAPDEAGDEAARAQCLASGAVRALAADAAAVVIVDGEGRAVGSAGSDDGARDLGGIETGTGAGPALECGRTGRVHVFDVAAAGDRWPGWSGAALRLGLTRAEAVPLQVPPAGPVGGLLLLCGPGRHRPDPGLVWAGVAAAALASALISQRALHDLRRRADQLQTALASRVVIEQAKGVLAERGGLDLQTAFDRMRRYARAHRRRLADVAGQVVDGDVADAVLTHVPPRRGAPSILDP